MYKLRAKDMLLGLYRGHQGPALDSEDAFEIGRQAFLDGYTLISAEWLELTVSLETKSSLKSPERLWHVGKAASLLGRSYMLVRI